MTVGFYAPLPPVRSGVADYASSLLAAMPGPCIANADGEVNMYHLGNNGLHGSIYRRAMEQPGVVVLHDAVMHHFFLGALQREAYLEEFSYHYGEWTRGIAEQLWAGRSRSASDARYFRWPMLRRIAERAKAVIVHNAGAAEKVLREAPSVRVETIPHIPLATQPIDAIAVERWRAEHGIRPSDCVFGLMGYLRESKRVATVLHAFRRLRSVRCDVFLLVAGSFASSDLERAVDLSGAGVLRKPHAAETEFQIFTAVCDAGINLRYPSAGESSGMTTRWMQLGVPVLVSDTAESRILPIASCPRVLTGEAEEESLLAYMIWLADSPTRRRVCGQEGLRYVQEELSTRAIASRFWRVLEECRGEGSEIGRPVRSS